MADDQQICPGTHSENNESFFFLRMLRIINHQCAFIIKNSFGFFERHFMLFLIDPVFILIPFKRQHLKLSPSLSEQLYYNYLIIISQDKD